MPVSIVAPLLLCSALLAPGAGPDTVPSVGVDRTMTRMVAADPIATIRSWPVQDQGSWIISEADTEEEESGDGDSDGMSSDAGWTLPLPHDLGLASSLRSEKGFLSPPTRSPILRC